jgi:protein subunit release factor B
MSKRELVFSVTASDWSYTRGTGNGGQKKNKTNSAVHCTHRASGAHGYAEDHRSQHQNRSLAFERMAKTKKFEDWRHLEFLKRTGQEAVIQDNVERQMRKIKVEVKDDGLWKEVDKNAILPDEEQETSDG